jgi:hypothetical protein
MRMQQQPSNIMQRKIGAEEAEDGFLFVEKSWLTKLPAPGATFYLTVGKSQLKTKIQESAPCSCREPVHVHYRIPLPLMNPVEGKTATLRIVKDDKLVLEYE